LRCPPYPVPRRRPPATSAPVSQAVRSQGARPSLRCSPEVGRRELCGERREGARKTRGFHGGRRTDVGRPGQAARLQRTTPAVTLDEVAGGGTMARPYPYRLLFRSIDFVPLPAAQLVSVKATRRPEELLTHEAMCHPGNRPSPCGTWSFSPCASHILAAPLFRAVRVDGQPPTRDAAA